MSKQATTRARTESRRPRRWSDEQSLAWYRVFSAIATLLFRYWVRCFRVIGAENVPRTGSAFIVANHTSGIDPIIVGVAVPHRFLNGPGKIELFKNPVFAYLLRKIGIFPLRVGQVDAAAVRTMVDLYRHDRVVVVYPEGGRTESGEMREFNPDFARLVLKLKAPIIPAGIAGARDVLPIGSWIPRPRTPVVVKFGQSFQFSELYDRELTPEVVAEATSILHGRVADMVAEARRERDALAQRC